MLNKLLEKNGKIGDLDNKKYIKSGLFVNISGDLIFDYHNYFLELEFDTYWTFSTDRKINKYEKY